MTLAVSLLLTLCLISWIAPTPAIAMTSVAGRTAAKMSQRVAIIGGGVSGCASARRLAQLLVPTSACEITLYEIGRGPGGRASTRRTRSHPHLYINHGAPYADIRSEVGRSVISSLGPKSTAPFRGIRGSLDSDTGTFSKYTDELSDGEGATPLYVTGNDGEMSRIAESMIRDQPTIITKYKTMVRSLSRTSSDGEWELRDKHDTLVGTADWLVVAGSGIAHPRWSDTFGGEPPLIAAEREHPDPNLREALDVIGTQRVSPVLAVFFSSSGSDARKWLSLDYDVAEIRGDTILSKVVIQGGKKDDGEEEWCSVVLHSTEAFALENVGVYGASSSAARIGDATTDASREEMLIEEMIRGLTRIPGMPEIDITEAESKCDYGPVLHRWGNAFPKGEALSDELAFVPTSRVAFCGDYVASSEEARFGSFESALLSGTFAAEKIAKDILEDQ